MHPMMCFWVELDGEEWGMFLHARSRGQAKKAFVDWSPDPWIGYDNWTGIRTRRVRALDDKPITYENCVAAGHNYLDENGEDIGQDEFENYCRCYLCKQDESERDAKRSS